MQPSTPRAVRVASQVQRSLALRLREVKDPRVGNVTVTTVSVAPDLTVAYVNVLPFGSEHRDETLAGLRSAAGYLRGAVGRDLHLRRAPRLEFALDEQLEQAHRLTELIDRAVTADRASHDPKSDA
jgi:ribosome-binding factor A